MSAANVEAFLARIYVDADARSRFKADPFHEARKAGLSNEECKAVEKVDFAALELAARSFAWKKQHKRSRSWILSFVNALRRSFAILFNELRRDR
jgi:hypothetical protein